MNNVLAVDIGSSHVRAGLFDHAGACLKVVEDGVGAGQPRDSLLEQMHLRCAAFLDEFAERTTACGVSFGGLVDFERQLVTSLHLPGWERFPLADWFQQKLGLPCRADNDANAGALGELRFGLAKTLIRLPLCCLANGCVAAWFREAGSGVARTAWPVSWVTFRHLNREPYVHAE